MSPYFGSVEYMRAANWREFRAALNRWGAPSENQVYADIDGNIYVTDVEHGSVLKVGPDGSVVTVVRSPRIRWADALSFGPDGWLYLADSAIPELVLKPREHVRSQAPYFIFRFRPGHSGVPGQ